LVFESITAEDAPRQDLKRVTLSFSVARISFKLKSQISTVCRIIRIAIGSVLDLSSEMVFDHLVVYRENGTLCKTRIYTFDLLN
jgi:hypothetical protein